MDWQRDLVGLVAGFVLATVTTPVGVSGAVFLLPVQLSVLHVPNPRVTPTNLLFNVISGPGGLARYRRRGQFDRALTRQLLAGSVPGVLPGRHRAGHRVAGHDADSGATGDRPGNHHLVGAAAAACAVCCAAPIVGFLGVAGSAATAVTLAFAGVVFAFVVGLLFVAAVLTRRARVRRMSCAPADPTASCPELVELGPTRTTDDA